MPQDDGSLGRLIGLPLGGGLLVSGLAAGICMWRTHLLAVLFAVLLLLKARDNDGATVESVKQPQDSSTTAPPQRKATTMSGPDAQV